jgi:hypothetical protein
MNGRGGTTFIIRATAVLLALLIGGWLCLQAVYVVGGAETTAPGPTQSYTVTISDMPQSDGEILAAAIAALTQAGWWRDYAELVVMGKWLDCEEAETVVPVQYLSFWRRDQLGLLTSHVYRADVDINQAGELIYTLQDYFLRNELPGQGLNMERITVSSRDALAAAEEQGGLALRQRLDNQCRIAVLLTPGSSWSVDYLTKGRFARLLCLDVDPTTGAVKQVTRNFIPCTF